MMNWQQKLLLGSASIMSMTAPIVANAQAAPAGSQQADATQDIIVTATRSATNLQNTPVAVTAISGDALKEKGATSLLDVQNLTPSLTVSSRSNTGTTSGGYTIRGIGVDATNSSAAVGLYVDEVYYPAGAGNLLGLFDVDRVEVLRGPQGTLFGRNTIAGAIQYITTKPSQDLGGFVEGTYGNFDRAEIAGAINLPITDTLAIRASGRYNRQGGFVHDQFADIDRGREVTKQGRLALRWKPTSTLTVDLKGEILQLDQNGRALAVTGFNSSLNPPGTPNGGAALVFAAIGSGLNPALLFTVPTSAKNYSFAGFNSPDSQQFDYRSGQANIAWDISNTVRLKSISAYSFNRNTSLVDFDNTAISIIQGSRGTDTDKLFTQELQLSGIVLNDGLHFTLGGYYFNDLATTRSRQVTFGTSPLVIPVTNGDVGNKTTALAGYGQITYDFTGRLSAVAGIRYSDEHVTARFLNARFPNPFNPGTPVVLPAQFAPLKSSFSDWSPAFGLNFQADRNLLIYAKASKGFRAGGIAADGNLVNPAPPAPAITATPGYQPFDPETAWTYELGTRMQFLNKRIRINPTIFYTDWKNIQFNTFVFNPSPNIITRNAGDARIWGVELEWAAQVSRAFSLSGSFSYLNGKYTRIAPGIAATLGSPLQHTPPIKFSLGARYVVPLANLGKLALSTDYAFVADQRSAVSDTDFIKQPEYGLLNARVQYTTANGRYAIALYGTNLANKYYYVGGVNGFATFGSVEADLGRPREYGVNAKVNF